MNIIVAFTYILVGILVVAGAYGIIFSSLYGSNHSLTPNTPKGLRTDERGLASYNLLASALALGKPLCAKNLLLLNSVELEVDKKSDALGFLSIYNWKTSSDGFVSLLAFMENIARSYNRLLENAVITQKKFNLLRKFVNALDKELQKESTPIAAIPWGDKAAPFTIFLPRFLSCYLIMLGRDLETLDRNKALNLLKRLVPKYNESLGKKYTDYMAVYLAIPYLVGVLVERPENLKEEQDPQHIQHAYEFMNPVISETDKISKNRWYDEWSYTITDNEFSYTPIVALAGFYSDIWVSLNLPFSGKALFRNALNKILHPDLNIVPLYAFNGYCGIEHNFKFYGSEPNYGIFVYPAVGVGVYKTPEMYFHLRVQKSGQAIYLPKENSRYSAGLLAVTSRKIYFTDNCKEVNLECADLFHPHVIHQSAATSSVNKFENEKITPDSEVHSFIGIIDNYLVWMNKYKLEKVIPGQVYEIGIFCPQGAFQYYSIKNDGSDEYKFTIADGSAEGEGSVILKAGETTTIHANQIINTSFNPNLAHISEYNFTFNTPQTKYEVKYDSTKRIATITNGDKTYLLSESPKLRDSITENGVQFNRNTKSLTYYDK